MADSFYQSGNIPAQQGSDYVSRRLAQIRERRAVLEGQLTQIQGRQGGMGQQQLTPQGIAEEYMKANPARTPEDKMRVQNEAWARAKMALDSGVVSRPSSSLDYGQRQGLMEQQQKYMMERAGQNPELTGQIAEARAKAEGEVNLGYAPKIEAGKVLGKNIGEKEVLIGQMQSRIPQLIDVTQRLSNAGRIATYTRLGRLWNEARKETRFNPTEEAVARDEYTSIVDNEVLPLLRETFGAQFTQKEGESLKITLGDPDKPPASKDAVLRSFMRSKLGTINSIARELGKELPFSKEDIDAIVSNISITKYNSEATKEKPVTAQPTQSTPIKIKNDADYDALPSGATFIDPQGNPRRKP